MKKIFILSLILTSTLIAQEYNLYSSKIGVGIGVGLPTGYEARLIYRPIQWLSFSLNYNKFAIEDVKIFGDYTYPDTGERYANFNVTGNIVFSTPGIMMHYHPLGGNLRLSTGFLIDMSDIGIKGEGSIDLEPTTVEDTLTIGVQSNFSFKYGNTYPYVGIGYGYDYKSTIHFDISAGFYLIKSPKIKIDARPKDYDDLIALVEIITKDLDVFFGDSDFYDQYGGYIQLVEDSLKELRDLGGNLLDLGLALNNVLGIDIVNLNAKLIEESLAKDFNSIYDMSPIKLPKIGGYNVLPVISVGFTVFLF